MRVKQHLTRRMTSSRAACAALATLAALIGGSGAAHAAATPKASAGAERGTGSHIDSSAQVTGRDQPCPDGWLCLYEHRDFNHEQNGHMLKFKDDKWQPLNPRGFNDKTSSWRNRMGRTRALRKVVCPVQGWLKGVGGVGLCGGLDAVGLG